jgi:menaquinone-dependent protoporphyrinogen IX oxidase
VDVTERKATEAKMQSLVQELQQKVSELEQFEQVVVGRELKMIELEREVETLRRRLSGPARLPFDSGG